MLIYDWISAPCDQGLAHSDALLLANDCHIAIDRLEYKRFVPSRPSLGLSAAKIEERKPVEKTQVVFETEGTRGFERSQCFYIPGSRGQASLKVEPFRWSS